ncbi:uncharacterized protein N7473_010489 [Penicillium subrubescens]|uniref:uncharacterized protein n=1 Tax=Penicillium subrubescens TaxID=1316194 RepID=UPI0025456BDA|nr:uncharacterized protein N7473_010489 [Penicillium subrubescens]KAJ5883603.1 hypothetical protein N7473_010489 [Penicillium subrubescens]
MAPTKQTQPPLTLDSISESRALQTLEIYFTILLNRQITRRFQLEQQAMHDLPVSQRFRPVILLEPVPTLQKPHSPSTNTLAILKTKIHLLRARVEKGKELASEIERRMQNPYITFPTHFCHTCVVDGESGGVEVLLTKCGHRVCRTCLGFGMDGNGVYECSICFRPAQFVVRETGRSPLGVEMGKGMGEGVGEQKKRGGCPGQIANVSRRFGYGGDGGGKGFVRPLVCPK